MMTDNTQTLLIVDDEVNILKAMKRCLNNAPYEVLTASSPEEGLEMMDYYKVDVVLSDFRMPNMTGGELIDKISEKQPDTVSMLISGYTDFEAALDVINNGVAYRFLQKPWNNQALRDEVQQAFSEHQKRKQISHKMTLLESDLYAEKVPFEQAVASLFAREKAFSVVTLQVEDHEFISQHVQQTSNANLLNGLRQTVIQTLSEQAEVFHTGAGQLNVILPEYANEVVLYEQLLELHQKLNQPIKLSGLDISLHSQISYAVAPADGSTADQLLANLHLVSCLDEEGKGEPVARFDKLHIARKKRQYAIKSGIREAIDQHHFQLYLQPKVALPNRRVVAAEVLMRWQHAELGWISPAEFISLSELDGQIEAIGEWLLQQSVKLLADVKRSSPDLERISINVSAKQIRSGRILEQLVELIEKYQFDPDLLELEITETCIIDDFQHASKILWHLKLLGVHIAIDDFGTGYSSLAYLTKLPIDVVKLDKAIIEDICVSDSVKSMVEGLIKMCHEIGIKVVAEGCEDGEQANLLESIECDQIQGFVFSSAVRRQEFEKLMLSQPFVAEKYLNDSEKH